jgi:hypothetical protein
MLQFSISGVTIPSVKFIQFYSCTGSETPGCARRSTKACFVANRSSSALHDRKGDDLRGVGDALWKSV